ncbi:MAG: hypothetical protein ACLFVG_10570 [Candidatus Aminicenantes bacterium]
MNKDRLDGWKEISQYLDRDIRTCQRWEKDFGLPVYRLDDQSSRSIVFSYKSEIDQWLRSCLDRRQIRKKFHLKKASWMVAVFFAAALILASFGLYCLLSDKNLASHTSSSDQNPIRWELKGEHLAFYDLQDHFLWSKKIENPVVQNDFYQEILIKGEDGNYKSRLNLKKVDFSDIDGDKKNEVLCFLNHQDPRKRCISLLDNNGRELWTESIEFNQEFEGGKISHSYVIRQLQFNDINHDGTPEVLALWIHSRRFPSIFAVYDHQGHEILKYAHTGILRLFTVYSDEDHHKRIFLGGTNNLLDGNAVLSVIDCRQFRSGLAPPYSVPDDLAEKHDKLKIYVPKNPVPAHQVYYLRVKHNEFSRKKKVKWLNILEVLAGENEIIVQTFFDLSRKCSFYYVFDPGLHLQYVIPGADLEREYDRMFDSGMITTPFQDFLDQRQDDVLFWDGKGWAKKPKALPF